MTPEDRTLAATVIRNTAHDRYAAANSPKLAGDAACTRALRLGNVVRLHELADELAAPPVVHLVHRYDAYATGDLAHTSTEAFATLEAATARAAELGEDVDTVTVG